MSRRGNSKEWARNSKPSTSQHGRNRGRGRGRENFGYRERSASVSTEVLFDANPLRQTSFSGSSQSLASQDDRRSQDGRRNQDGRRDRGRGCENGGNRGRGWENGGNRGRGRGNGGDRGRGDHRSREAKFNEHGEYRDVRQMRYKDIQDLYQKDANVIIISLMDQSRGFKELLNAPSIGIEMLVDIVKMLSKAFSTAIHQYNQNELLAILISSSFFNHVSKMIFDRNIREHIILFQYLIDIFEEFLDKMPDVTCEELDPYVRLCAAAATTQSRLMDRTVLERIQELSNKIDILQEEKKNEMYRNKKVKLDYMNYQDEPPEDFREIAITPCIKEIRASGRPFLRPNIVEGAYKDADHYLDVQFRLLREDFISPLRDGINEYLFKNKNRSDKNQKIRDIRLYEDVRIKEPKMCKDGVFYSVQFSTNQFRRVKWEISRRLIFGSLLCLSSDNFETVIFASVADRKPEDLKKGIVVVKFEDDLEIKKELTKREIEAVYIMAESQGYFEAYRHVLKGLQSFNNENLPLQDHIVHVRRSIELPSYLDRETIFDFTNIIEEKKEEDHLYPPERFRQTRARVSDIHTWPSCESMALDESQRKAMFRALSSAVAVIQGPPGTGKTYVGLKIVKALLSNKHVWRPDGESNPILIVCLTNHALDQFLEGMTRFTQNLIRVGGRCKNETLSRYNLRYIRDRLQSERRRETYIFKNVVLSNERLRALREKMEMEKQKGLLLNVQILHERALGIMKGVDKRLVDSLIGGFVEYYEYDPMNEACCPTSFLATWLGLTVGDFVQEWELDNFLHDESNDFDIVGGKRRKIEQSQVQLPDLSLLAEAEAEIDSDDELIDVEDEVMAANRNRQMEADEIEEIQFLKVPSLNSDDWSVFVDCLYDPEYLLIQQKYFQVVTDENGENKILVEQLDPEMYELYMQMGNARQIIAKRELANTSIMSDEDVGQLDNVWFLEYGDRWKLYRRWIHQFRESVEGKIVQLRREYEKEAKRLKEVINEEELSILRHKDIVGMTTTGAAKYLETLRELKPKIVIVEEAAEVLESHIITALSSSTEHLILIGDHQQLRPNVTVYRLSKDYNMDVSLFERLIKNNVQYETLQLQHRMRPEISQLLKPHIYRTLEDHPIVQTYERIKGTKSSLFFFNHSNPEEAVTDSKTHANPFEAEYLVALCRYLLQQGYDHSQITILTAYAGQLFALRKLMDKNTFEGIKVTVVDNFQGEENDIILLSFVRSNEEGKIGFLKIDNRINVALSRAKKGLFCVGNFKFFASKSDIWRKICNYLEIHEYIGDEMTLQCQKHEQITTINKPGDFQRSAPEGGCLQPCGEKLNCSHYCRRVCHVTPHTKCEQECIKEICELKHTCPLKCYQICQPCRVLVLKYHLDCDHSEYHPCFVDIATIKCKVMMERELKCEHKVPLECHVDVDTYECIVKVKRDLPQCGHERVMKCHQDPLLVHCKVDCGARLDCGHVCPNKCHPSHDPEHEHVECRKPCEKKCEREHKCQNLCYQPCSECLRFVEKQRSCGHKIQHPCSKEIIERPMELLGLRLSKDMGYVEPCNEPCTRTLPCTHSCEKKCYEPCGDCKVIVDKILVCGHVIKAECSASILRLKCTTPCNKTLPCGHQCPNNCGGKCEIKCTTPVTRMGLCGHNIDTPCYLKTASSVEIAQFCKHACNAQLECEHQCMGTCGECRQGRVHIPCKEKCGRTQICGHSCTFPCATMCPPCNKKCSTQCVHSRCPKKCGQPCKKCQEKCRWQCEHHECMKKCGEICDREPCNEPCFRLLRCGHQCIGLCGEKCPKLCRVCNRDELLDFMLLGNEEDENARFLQLADCGHCIEVEGMDYWMMVKTEEIKMKECPKCKTTIWKSYRYGNIIKQKMEQVQKVKKRVFGKERNLRKTMHQVHETIDHCRLLKTHFPTQIKKLVKRLTGKQAVHQNQLVVIQNQVNILTSMANIKDKFSRVIKASEANRYFESDLDFLVNRLMKNEEKMNEFEIQDIGKELTRIELYTMFLNIQETPKTATAVYHLNTAKRLLTSGHKLTNDEERDVEEGIKKAADYVPGLAITNTERLMIVKAVGLGAGRWFTCPNGHVYVIGECGGAMERSRCPECKAVIGGANHALERDNRHFGAMDGSSRPAWGNNTGIGNYDLNDMV